MSTLHWRMPWYKGGYVLGTAGSTCYGATRQHTWGLCGLLGRARRHRIYKSSTSGCTVTPLGENWAASIVTARGLGICNHSGHYLFHLRWHTRRSLRYAPGVAAKKMDLLQLVLWNSAFFAQRAKSRVPENQFRTFYCPRMAKQGMLRVGDSVTALREINTETIPQFPPSYRAFYVKCLVSYIDAVAGTDPLPVMPRLPGIDSWKLSSVLHACRGQLQAEERQPTKVWAALHS